MDRSMYGKFTPGSLKPYQCSIKKGTSPGCEGRELKRRKKIPIYVVENHHEVVPFLHRNIGSKRLPMEGSTFVHFDSHPDMLIPLGMPANFVFEKEKLYQSISIENWLMPLMYAGHFGRVVWIKPPWSRQIQDGSRTFHIGRDKHTDEIRLDCKENYFVSECLYERKENMDGVKRAELDVLTLGNAIRGDVDDASRIGSLLGNSDVPFVLDVDLDFFSTGNPFKRIYEKADLYSKLKDIYFFNAPSVPAEDNIMIEATKNRKHQISTLRKLFEHLEKHRCMPESDVDCELWNKVDAVRKCVLDNYDDKDVDWSLIHDAGCTCDESELPDHVSSPEELEIMFAAFRAFVESIPFVPTLITVSRSCEDDYTPFENVELIQETVLSCLASKFDCDEPVLDYLDNITD